MGATTASAARDWREWIRSRWVYPDPVVWLLIAAYVALRIVVVTGGEVFTSYDTASYAVREDSHLNRGPLISLIGHAPRLWGVPTFYALLPTDAVRAIAQWAVATF